MHATHSKLYVIFKKKSTLFLKMLKKIVLALCLLYSINILLSNFGIIIPINIFSITTVSLLGGPGIIGLVVLNKML